MQFEFYKYQACGNDFVLVDLRSPSATWASLAIDSRFWQNETAMRLCCDRRFGIGADGILIILPAESSATANPGVDSKAAFHLHYLNADGKEGSLCGNGSRCAAAHAFRKGYFEGNSGTFTASDGLHQAMLTEDGWIALGMQAPKDRKVLELGTFINTGSPHLVVPVRDLVNYPVDREGRALREHSLFLPGGTNVNFMEVIDINHLKIRTFERGVEAETLSCGTGAVACAILHVQQNATEFMDTFAEINLQFRGGQMNVSAQVDSTGSMHQIQLKGPAFCVFKGLWMGYTGKTYLW
jgi:diaminopimelate epimerase